MILGASQAAAIGAAWLLQIIAGRWHTAPTWSDRAGRLIGVFWLVKHPLETVIWKLS